MEFELEAGSTPLVRSEALCREFRLENLLVKDESRNPLGTFKDRRSEFILKEAIANGVDRLIIITSGNAGYSLGGFCKGSNIGVVSVVDKSLDSSVKDILGTCSEVVEVYLSEKFLTSDDLIALAPNADGKLVWDASNGFLGGYRGLIQEIKYLMPDFLIVPFGSGQSFVGFYEALKMERLPTGLIGVGAQIDKMGVADKLWQPWTPYGPEVESILGEGHRVIKLGEEEIVEAYEKWRDDFDVEPSSAVVFGALSKLGFARDDRIVVINSGRGAPYEALGRD